MKKKFILVLIFVFILLIKINNVESLNDYNNGSGSTGTTTQSGSYNQVTGVRVAVIDINGDLVDGTHVVDIISRKDSLNNKTYNVFSSQATKIQYWKGKASVNNTKKLAYSNGVYSTNNNVQNASDILGADNDFGNYITNTSNTSLSDILKSPDNTYTNLKKIVKQTGYNCLETPSYDKCNSNQYIVIEPMVQAGDYILTGYEMTRQFAYNSSYRRIYINMAKTIYVDKTVSDFSGINVCNVSDLSNNGKKSYNAMSYLNEGCGIGLYNVTDFVEIPEPEPEPDPVVTCESQVTATDTIDRRIELFGIYGHRALLNLGNTGSTACGDVSNLAVIKSCLSGQVNDGEFSITNLSHYDEPINVGGTTTGYCLTTFNLSKQIDFQNINVISGKLIQNTDKIVTKGILTKKCYVPGYNGGSIGQSLNYSQVIGDVYLGNNKLEIVSLPSEQNLEYNSTTSLYESSIEVSYRLGPIYLEKQTGKYFSTSCVNCQFLSYGLLSKFSDKGIVKIPFSFEFNGITHTTTTDNEKCSYIAIPEIIINNTPNEYKLNLEFRPFKTDNAFPGKSGSTREKGSNWSIFNLDYNKDDIVNLDDLTLLEQIITNGEFIDLKYDINWDLEVNKHDTDLIRSIINKYINSSEDTYAEEMLSHRPNSYGYISKTNTTITTPKYVIELTPSDIKDIRKYNKNTSYDDYNLVCDTNGNHCTSSYLTTLQAKGVLTINNSRKR